MKKNEKLSTLKAILEGFSSLTELEKIIVELAEPGLSVDLFVDEGEWTGSCRGLRGISLKNDGNGLFLKISPWETGEASTLSLPVISIKASFSIERRGTGKASYPFVVTIRDEKKEEVSQYLRFKDSEVMKNFAGTLQLLLEAVKKINPASD